MKKYLCKIGIHTFRYFDVPKELMKMYWSAPQQARTCRRCGTIQVPYHDTWGHEIGKWTWKTIRGINGLPTEDAKKILS